MVYLKQKLEEPCLEDLMEDPVIKKVMKSDNVAPEDLTALLAQIALEMKVRLAAE